MMRLQTYEPPIVIEQLIFDVNIEARNRWIELDHEIWTGVLAECEGFAGKEIWIDPEHPRELTVIIYWTSHECWEAIDPDLIAETTATFDQAVGEGNSTLVKVAHKERQFYKLTECVT